MLIHDVATQFITPSIFESCTTAAQEDPSHDIAMAKNKLHDPLPVSERTSGRGVLPPVDSILELICKLPALGADMQMLCRGRSDMRSRWDGVCLMLRGSCIWKARDLRGTLIPRSTALQ